MPELPEVETIVRDLRSDIVNEKITDIIINYEKSIATPAPNQFIKLVENQKILAITRRAKYIVIDLANPYYLIMHMRMTGKLILQPDTTQPTKHDHIVFQLSNANHLLFNDTRKFGRFYLVKNTASILGKLGPEPLGDNFYFEDFSKKLSKTSRQIKPLLLDQQFVAGLGNIYTDEALWEAGIHPKQPANLLSPNKKKVLFSAIKQVLRKGIDNRGTSLGNGDGNYTSSDNSRGTNQKQLTVFARNNQPCLNCNRPIKKIVVAQRGTHYCSNCQRLRKK